MMPPAGLHRQNSLQPGCTAYDQVICMPFLGHSTGVAEPHAPEFQKTACPFWLKSSVSKPIKIPGMSSDGIPYDS